MNPESTGLQVPLSSSHLLIDSNLLLLLIMGSFQASLIGNWKRLSMFTVEDFACLQGLVAASKGLLVTPHILTEVSNLANSLPQWQKAEWSGYFRKWILEGLHEQQIRAVDIVRTDAFVHFGITDAALFHASDDLYVLTVDARLAAYLQSHRRRVINFNHLRQSWLLP